ncbi:MAG: DUF3365 domain-containing protein [Pirellulaceae bacterium]
MRIYVLAGIGLAVLGAIVASTLTSSNTSVATAHAASTSSAPDEAAVERTRKTVRMLDDIYKTAVVLITEHYVHDEDDLSAASAAAVWFDIIEEKGWHSARLVDATGQPYDEANVAEGDFETMAIAKIKEGESYVDEVSERDGKPVLRAMTAIPVVMEKCVMCHPHYAHAEEGQAIGAVSYIVPIDE